MSVIQYRTTPQPGERRGRAGLLLGFGVALIIAGGIFGFFALMIPIGMMFSRTAARGPVGVGMWSAIPAFLVVAIPGAALVWTGIASIRLRRWCRPVVLSIAGWMMFAGVMPFVQMGIQYVFTGFGLLESADPNIVGRNTAAAQQAADQELAQRMILVGMAVIGIVVPLIFIMAYRRRDVQETLDEADPAPAWTDGCPTPVLALAIGLAWASFLTLIASLTAITLFLRTYAAGSSIQTTPVSVYGFDIPRPLFLALGFLLAWGFFASARMVYRQNQLGVWLAVALIALIAASIATVAAEAALADPFSIARGRYTAFQMQQQMQVASVHSMINIGVYVVPLVLFAFYTRGLMKRT